MQKIKSRNIYQPKEGFICQVDGVEYILNEGHRFAEGHPVVEKYPDHFRIVPVSYDVEQATDNPGEPRR